MNLEMGIEIQVRVQGADGFRAICSAEMLDDLPPADMTLQMLEQVGEVLYQKLCEAKGIQPDKDFELEIRESI